MLPSASTADPAAAAAPPPSDQALELLAAEVRRLASHLAAHEARFDELAAALGALQSRHDETMAAVDDVRAAASSSKRASWAARCDARRRPSAARSAIA